MMPTPKSFDSMARKSALLMQKELIEQAAPIIFKIEDIIIENSGTQTHKKLSSAIEPVIRFYLIEETAIRYADESALFLQRLPEYIRTYRDAFEKVLHIRSPKNPENYLHALIHIHLGKFYDLIELHDKAELHYNRAINVLSNRQLSDSDFMAVVLCNLGRTYFLQGREIEAEMTLNNAYDIQKATGREYTSITLQIINNLAVCVADDKVHAYIKKATKVRKKIFAPESPENSESFMGMAEMFGNQGKYSIAIGYYKKALQYQRNENPIDHKKIFYTLYLLALRSISTGNYKAAYQYFVDAQREETLSINQMIFMLNDKDRLEFLEETYKYLYLYVTFVKLFMIKN